MKNTFVIFSKNDLFYRCADFAEIDKTNATLRRIRRPNPVRQGRKVEKRRSHFSARKKFCIPMRTVLADMWCCVRNRLCDPWLFQEERSFSFFLLPFHHSFSLCNVDRRVSHSRCCSFGAGKPRHHRDWSPSARVQNRTCRLCNVFIFFLLSCIPDNLGEQTELYEFIY